jgi:hypothetical protein
VGEDTVLTTVGLSNLPDAMRRRDTMAGPDYVDLFTAVTRGTTDKSAEDWARALLEDTPTGRSAPLLWRLLGLRLGPTPSPDSVQGWKIADRGDDWIRIEATSWFMTAHAVVEVHDPQVSLALFIRYDRPIAAVIWPPVSVMHRRAVPVMLRQALDAHASRSSDISLDRADRTIRTAPPMDGGRGMRLPNTAHTSRPWRIHELTRDFRLEDVWALPGRGGPGDFGRLVQSIASSDPARSSSAAARTLFAIRWRLGELFGWDAADAGVGARVRTLRDRLPADLRDGPSGPAFDALPFTSLYLTEDEWAAEIANRTMHGVLHIGRVPDETGGFTAQMAVLVKPNGLLGDAYMAAIRPFRYLLVYPAMMREMGRKWRAVSTSAG